MISLTDDRGTRLRIGRADSTTLDTVRRRPSRAVRAAHHQEAAFIFLLALLTLTAAAALASLGLRRSMSQVLSSQRSIEVSQALHLTDAAVDTALWELNRSSANFMATDPTSWQPYVGQIAGFSYTCTPTFLAPNPCRQSIVNLTAGQAVVTVANWNTAAPTIYARGLTARADSLTGQESAIVAVTKGQTFNRALWGLGG